MTFQFDKSAFTNEEAERLWFRDLLWQAFPKCRSENELAERASAVLSRKNRPVTTRAVRNWLRCDNTPSFRYVMAVIALVGVEKAAAALSPREGVGR